MAATTGLACCSSFRIRAWPRAEKRTASSGSSAAISARSAPAAKHLCVPVMTTARTSGVCLEAWNSRWSSSSTARVRRGKPEGSSSSIRRRPLDWLARTASVPRGAAAGTAASGLLAGAAADKFDDFLRGCSGEEHGSDAGLFQSRDVGLGDDAADQHGDLLHPLLAEQLHQLRAEGVVRAGEDREPDDVHIFLRCGRGYHLRGLAQTGVNHFHPGVAQRAGDNLSAAVVAVQPRLGNQHPYLLFRHRTRGYFRTGLQG